MAYKKQLNDTDDKISIFDSVEDSIFADDSITDKVYKLNMYTSNGQLRYEVSPATAYEIGRLWGDIVRAIPSTYWSTIEEICESVKEWERRSYRKSFTRERSEIEEAVEYLVQAGVLLTR